MSNKEKSRRRRGARKSQDGSSERRKSKDSSPVAEAHDVMKYRPHKSQLINLTEETPTWYECGRHTPGRDDTIFSDPPQSPLRVEDNSQLALQYRSVADDIYQTEVQLFSNGATGASDQRWIESTMKHGTLKDRIASMSIVVNTNPVHKLYALDSLLQLAGCSEGKSPGQTTNSRVSQMAAEALADLFENTLLPSHRKLYTLEQRPLYRYSSSQYKSKKTLSPRILLLWRYEEFIKNKYDLFVHHYLAQTLLYEGMELPKVFVLRTCGMLLRAKPECEEQLLSIMVNKLGDPSKKIAACAGHELRRVLDQHSNMQVVIAREVQQLSHRPHLSPRALYNCIIFLNQLKLFREDDADEKDNRSLKKKTTTNLPASLINTYFRLFEVAVNQTNKDRNKGKNSSPSGMPSRLLSALLTGVNRAHPYLPDKDKHMEEHIDAIYRIVHTAPPSACTQALMLLFHLAVGSEHESEHGDETRTEKETNKASASVEKTARQDRFYRALYAVLSQRALVSSGKHLTLFFNLLYKACKYDTDSVRVIAMSKRLLCTTLGCGAPVLAASLFLLNEVMKYHPELRSCLVDVSHGSSATAMLDPAKREPRAALVRTQDSQGNDEKDGEDGSSRKVSSAPLWEVALVSHHFHPSVSKFATTLSDISYSGDPLRDFSLVPFLDKFAYKNPKSPKSIAQHWKRGESVAERRSGTSGEIEALMALPVNDPAFIAKQDYNEQEEFFHKFFVERARRDEIKGIVRGKGTLGELENDESDDEGEQRAFDEAEAKELDHDFDAEIDTDSEEEAFVNSLAEKLMASSGQGKVNFDDEDPDMEGWSDLEYDDDDEESDGEDKSNSDNDSGDNVEEAYFDDDAFMDSLQDGSDDEDSNDQDTDSDVDVAGDLALVTGSDSSDEEENTTTDKNQSKRIPESFVDASEYEAIIEKSWKERKRPLEPTAEENDGDNNKDGEHNKKKGKKRKKRRGK